MKRIITHLSITVYQRESDLSFNQMRSNAGHACGPAREATSLSLSLFWRALKPQTSKENGAAPALNLRRESSRWVCECFEKRPLNSSSSAHAHARDSSTCLPLWLRKGSAQPAHPQSLKNNSAEKKNREKCVVALSVCVC